MEKRARTVLALGTFAAAGSASALLAAATLGVTAPATTGCYTHQCDQSSVSLGTESDGGGVGTGEVIQRDDQTITWESVPTVPAEGQTWTVFFGNETITFLYGPEAGIPADATVVGVQAWVAAQADAQANFVIAAGQLGEFANVDSTSVSIYNDTCAKYFLRVVVTFLVPDAGTATGNLPPGVTLTSDSELPDAPSSADGGAGD